MTKTISLNPASADELQQTIALSNTPATTVLHTSNARLPVYEAIEASRIEIGEVITGDPGSSASVEVDRGQGSQSLNFIIPQGPQGPQGPAGDITPELQGLHDAAQAAAQAAENFADGLVASPTVDRTEVLTAAQYDALTPEAGTLYVIEG